jgi:predicted negative regulator of RcsB-dependent stress response
VDFIDLIAAYGYALHNQLDRVVGWFRAVGNAAIPLVVGAILAFWAWRIFQKRRLIRLAAYSTPNAGSAASPAGVR